MPFKFTFSKIRFYISIAALVTSLIIILTGLYLINTHRASSIAAISMADRLFEEINGRIEGKYHLLLGSVKVLADSGSSITELSSEPAGDGLSHSSLEFMMTSVENFRHVFSVYAGYDSGNFIQIIATRNNSQILSAYSAPEGTEFIVRVITESPEKGRMQFWSYLDESRTVLGRSENSGPDYDPRKRPWYRSGKNSGQALFTTPYVFDSSKEPGITCSRRITGGTGVFGVDITLAGFTSFLKQQYVSDNGGLTLFDAESGIIARSATHNPPALQKTNLPETPVERYILSNPGIRQELLTKKTATVTIDKNNYLVKMTDIGKTFGVNQYLVSAAPVDDFTGHIHEMELRIFGVTCLILLITLPAVIVLSRKISKSLMRLSDEARKIQNFDFSESPVFSSVITEIHDLIQAFSIMKVTIRDRTDALIATQKKLEKLVDQGIALAAEQDINTLIEMIFQSAKELSSADGGILYLKNDDNQLHHEIIQIDSANLFYGGTTGKEIPFPPLPLPQVESIDTYHQNPACHAFITGRAVITDDVYRSGQFDFSSTRDFDRAIGYKTRTLLTVPLKPRQGETIGVLQLINHSDEKTGTVTPFTRETTGFVEALAAQAAVSLDNRNLVIAQINLFNAFIQLMAGAIDAKSPYTGGHCARVPEIACVLADAAGKSDSQPFKHFSLETDDEWHEFRVAAWLHDCGKVTTPEFVVDKSTKLETLYNRIHEIRTRFEILLRDAEIDYYKHLHQKTTDPDTLKTQLEQNQAAIKDDFSFIATCNIGGEYMDDKAISRIHDIASRTWIRHLDDRLGLSDDELKHLNSVPESTLPCIEHLLSDKETHITKRVNSFNPGSQIEGFNMEVPEYLYHNGEIYNLSIRKGTLNTEERFKINEHIIQTIIMLEKLPFPKHLSRVPEFAGSHHETVNGQGYPRRLTAEDMSIPARIMAIADIFEALTASDRPYKKAKTVSDALRIMAAMGKDGHIDSELFNLFLTSGGYSEYAQKFLAPEQNDPVNISNYLVAIQE